MFILLKDGLRLEGSPLECVEQMLARAGPFAPRELRSYIDWVADNTRRFEGVELSITGATDEVRALSLLTELVRAGLARWLWEAQLDARDRHGKRALLLRDAEKQASRDADARALADGTKTRAQLAQENAFLPGQPNQPIDFSRVGRPR